MEKYITRSASKNANVMRVSGEAIYYCLWRTAGMPLKNKSRKGMTKGWEDGFLCQHQVHQLWNKHEEILRKVKWRNQKLQWIVLVYLVVKTKWSHGQRELRRESIGNYWVGTTTEMLPKCIGRGSKLAGKMEKMWERKPALQQKWKRCGKGNHHISSRE